MLKMRCGHPDSVLTACKKPRPDIELNRPLYIKGKLDLVASFGVLHDRRNPEDQND